MAGSAPYNRGTARLSDHRITVENLFCDGCQHAAYWGAYWLIGCAIASHKGSVLNREVKPIIAKGNLPLSPANLRGGLFNPSDQL